MTMDDEGGRAATTPRAHLPAATWWNSARQRLIGRSDGSTGAPAGTHEDDVVAYYLHTWKDFRGAWMNADNRAMHFGYWDSSVATHQDSLARSNEVLASMIEPGRSTRCLDLGAGVGGTAMWLAQRHGCHVTGVTLVPDQAARIERYASERGLRDLIEARTADYHELPFPDATFDAVYAQEAICHARSPMAVLDEALRVLKPSGRLIFAEYVRTGCPPSSAMLRWQETWSMPVLIERGTLEEWAEARGLSWTLRDTTTHMLPSFLRLRALARGTVRAQEALRRVGLRSDVQLANVHGCTALYDSMVNGDWAYLMFSASKNAEPAPAG